MSLKQVELRIGIKFVLIHVRAVGWTYCYNEFSAY